MLLKEKKYFVAGIGTDIGKTFFVEKTCEDLRKKNIAVAAIKAIASGASFADKNSDSAKILSSLGLEISEENVKSITPWMFDEAVSPHFAAEKINQKINFFDVKTFCQKKISEAEKQNKFLFIEAAGGVMTPINYENNFLDLAAELQIPLLLLTANYLGSISHTLCALEALKSRKILVEKIIINKNLPSCRDYLIDVLDFKKTIEGFAKTEVCVF